MSGQPPQGPEFPPPQQGPEFNRPPQGWAPPPQAAGQPVPPQQGWMPPAQQGWPPPGPQSWPQPGQQGWPPPQPSPQRQPWMQQQPPPPRRRRRWPLAVGLALLVAVLGGALFAPSVLNRPAPTAPAPTSTALPLVTLPPAPQPTAKTLLTSGGDLGSPVQFTTTAGAGSLTVTSATWTHAGRMAPPEGKAYLIVDVTVACTSGELDVNSLDLRTTTEPASQSAFGADLAGQFPGVHLTAGRQQAGQIGFVLPEGQVTVALLDAATLKPVATRVVPGP